MESDLEPTPDFHESEPKLEVVEGNALAAQPTEDLTPSAFDQVMEGQRRPSSPEAEAPVYKNRVAIGIACLMLGIVGGRLTTQPKVETKYVDRTVQAVSTPDANKPTEAATTEAPKVDNAFKEYADLDQFNPWEPLDQGFPLPPKDTQANVVGTAGYGSNSVPPSLRGNIAPMDPGEITGPLPTANGQVNPNLPTNPIAGGKPQVDNGKVAIAGHERYVSIAMNGPEPTKGQASLQSIASAAGGSSRTFTHMSEEGTVESQGVLLIVPAAKVDATLAKIETLGGSNIDFSAEGLATEQQTRIQGIFSARLTKLRQKQKDLLVDFLDDAPVVKQINEAIDNETRAVSATRLPGNVSGMAVIRVLLK